MDKPGRTLRGRPKTGDVAATAGAPKKRGPRPKTAIPVAAIPGGRRSAAAISETGAEKKTTATTATLRTSPSRTRTSPVRRSSRSRSIIPIGQVASATATATATKLSATNEDDEAEEVKSSVKQTYLPTTLTTNTSSKAPNQITTTSSTHSSYSSVTQRTIEIRTSDHEAFDLTNFIRRSVSKSLSLGGKTNNDNEGNEREVSVTPSQTTYGGGSRYSRSVSQSIYDNDAEFSDTETNDPDMVIYEEDGVEETFESFYMQGTTGFCRKLPIPKEFGGWMGSLLLMISIPYLVYYLQWCCSAEKCEFKLPDYDALLDVHTWVRQLFIFEAVGAFFAFNMAVFVLSAVLLGRGVRLPGCVEYKFNAMPMTALASAFYAVAVYFKYPVADFIIQHYQHFGIYALLNSYIMALWAYFRSDILNQKESQCNIYAKSGNYVVDYALGRHLNPRCLGMVDFKLVYYRCCLLSVFLYSISLLYKIIQTPWLPKEVEGIEIVTFFIKNLKYDTAAMTCAGMLLLYILDSIVFEHHLASSFELQGEGFGCLLLLRYAATPMLLTSVAKYFYEHRTHVTCKFQIYLPLVLLFLGLVLKRFSNAIKYKYRIQPYHPHFQNMETIHTFQGRRLLLGSLWGRLRQPNYLGDIMCLVALTLPITIRFAWPPLISILLIVVVLLHRCLRVNDRNSAKYHSSWVRYRCIARNYLIPKIF